MIQPEPFAWTDRHIETLKRGWSAGLSCSIIAEYLGCTRNAVAAKARRLNLPERGTPIARLKPRRPKPAQKPKRKLKKSKPLMPVGPNRFANRPLGDRPCRFPMWQHGADSDDSYCGARAIQGLPYCPEHAALCYVAREDAA